MCSDRTVPFSVGSDGLLLHVRLTPKGGRDAIDGVENLANGQSVLKIRVRAVPEDGKANKALMKLLAESLGIPPSQIHHEAGLHRETGCLGPREDGEAAGVPGRRTHGPLQSRHGLDVVVQHVGSGLEHAVERGLVAGVTGNTYRAVGGCVGARRGVGEPRRRRWRRRRVD